MDKGGRWDDGEDKCSVIGDTGDMGFIDFKDDRSMCSYSPLDDDEDPIVISQPFPLVDGHPRSIILGETATDSITIKNTTSEYVDLWSVRIYASNPDGSFTVSLMKPPSSDSDIEYVRGFLESQCLEDRVLHPGKTLTVWLSCKPKELGLQTTVVHFVLENEKMERVVFLLADDKISLSLSSGKPFSRPFRKKQQFAVDEYIPSRRFDKQTGRSKRVHLPMYLIPDDVRNAIEMEDYPGFMIDGLSRNNYASYFKFLVYMEELQMEKNMRAFDMEDVSMNKKGPKLTSLVVPGLAEKRPSLFPGDQVFAMPANHTNMYPYEGFIYRVESDQVFLRFADELHYQHRDSNLYNVQFMYNRINMRRLYQAIDAADCLETQLLFPSKSFGARRINTTPFNPITSNLNDEQMRSVQMILGCRGGPPYLIHGPPGTGKTKTLVEAILQIYKTRPSARVLVCAPSNSAADHILDKILSQKGLKIRENEVFRLNAASRSYDSVEPDHIKFCYFEELVFRCPPMQALVRYRIIISTYMSAAQLYSEGMERGHFSHIFIDEAGQASEPETMVPISHLYRKKTVVVLAGDPMQLGALVLSKDSEEFGFGKSYLERLFECDLYYEGGENYVTKLVRNYRCHPQILHLPSKLFYNGELIACKDIMDSETTPWVKLLTNENFPVLFIGIQGLDEREGNNPSWFNRIEASKVVEIIKKLSAGGNLGEGGFGVITPYQQQVRKILRALEYLDMPDIKVGTVEQFLGQEREVIIISTVRSTIKHNEFDKTYCLGFLTNPRRFNVAVTRAKSLLIIIGNPHILCEDVHWNELLWHCSDNESYKGCGLPERKANDNKKEEVQENEEYLQEKDDFHYSDEGFLQENVSVSCNNNAYSYPKVENPTGWGDEEIPKVVTDEAEWSDGWKE